MKKLIFSFIVLFAIFLTGCKQQANIIGGGSELELAPPEADLDEGSELELAPPEADLDDGSELELAPPEADLDDGSELELAPPEADLDEGSELELAPPEADLDEGSELELAPPEADLDKGEKIGGSCNMIAESSICIDYIGSFWTQSNIEENCYGVFSSNFCEHGSIGGCNVAKNFITEMIVWMYPYGGEPIASENAPFAKPVCASNSMGGWVNAR